MIAEYLAECLADNPAETINKLVSLVFIGFERYLGRKNPAEMSAEMIADRKSTSFPTLTQLKIQV
jgi:hypothetical protein